VSFDPKEIYEAFKHAQKYAEATREQANKQMDKIVDAIAELTVLAIKGIRDCDSKNRIPLGVIVKVIEASCGKIDSWLHTYAVAEVIDQVVTKLKEVGIKCTV